MTEPRPYEARLFCSESRQDFRMHRLNDRNSRRVSLRVVATSYMGKVNLTSKDAGVASISFSFGTLGNQVFSIVDLAYSLLSARPRRSP